jgi:hypothetical protein
VLVIIAFAFIPVYLTLELLPRLTDDGKKLIDNDFDPSLIFVSTMVAMYSCIVLWPALRTFRRRNKTLGLARLSLEHTDLNTVLSSSLYFLFVEHLKSEFSVENCLFWKEVEQLKVDYGVVSGAPVGSKEPR